MFDSSWVQGAGDQDVRQDPVSGPDEEWQGVPGGTLLPTSGVDVLLHLCCKYMMHI
ncbi:hypothetical protein HanRHA438_Chr07g0305711 [Helianthus annuus]|nr:hypothetical protein HanRHA438_Chr07g0305711 [Helianthus annuus]